MPELKAFFQPRSLPEALALIKEHGDSVRPLAGGTSLVFSRSSRLERVVDLGRLGLNTFKQDNGGLHLGAMLTCAALRQELQEMTPNALYEAAGRVGSRILQNHITVGGNCVQVYAWSDLPVALLALGADFVIQGQETRTVAAEAFFDRHPLRVLSAGELLTEVKVSAGSLEAGSAYLKFGRTEMDHALASAGAMVALEGGRVSRARITVGAVRGLPQLLSAAAETLKGKEPGGPALEEAARLAAQEAKVTADYRATADYRKQLVASLVEDVLRAAAARAGGA